MSVTVYFGPPGTGKTTRLLERVVEAIRSGVPAERIAFLAFSRRAAAEARSRAIADLGLSTDQLRHWRTLHSSATRQLGGENLMDGADWADLGERLDLKFGKVDEETGEALSEQRERGTRLRYLYDLARAARRSLRDTWLDSDRKIIWLELERFAATVEAYKRERGLLDYADVLEHAPGRLDVDLAIVDEAQDLTPAQWDYATRAVASARNVCYAGDDDQAIYDWAGADVGRFLDLSGDRTILDRSFRLPRSIFDVASSITSRITRRQPKAWFPRDEPGEVGRPASVLDVPLNDGSWLLLARARYLLDHWAERCRELGLVYTLAGEPSVRASEVRAMRAWETYRRGEAVPAADLNAALELTRRETRFPGDVTVSPGALGALPIWSGAFTKIPEARRRYYEACLRRSTRSLTSPPTATISTIHGAKGGEADHVAVLTDLTTRVEHGTWRNPDAEHRVWYVAATRARSSLYLVRPQTQRSYAI